MLPNTMWRTNDLVDRYHTALINLPIFAPPQPIAFQQDDGDPNYGLKLTELSSMVSVSDSLSSVNVGINITLSSADASGTITGNVELDDACITLDSTDEAGHANGKPFRVTGLSSADRPKYNDHSMLCRIEEVASQYAAIHTINIAYSHDEDEDSGAIDYEIGACHPQVIPTGYAGWTPFDTGESCSTYTMAVLLAHNTNRVNYCTVPRHSVMTKLRGMPSS